MHKLVSFSQHRFYWLALLLLGIAQETTALIYQYALDFQPCVLCIHVRLWVVALMLVAIFGFFVRKHRSGWRIANILTVVIALGLLDRAWQLLGVERGFIAGTCDFDLGLPSCWQSITGCRRFSRYRLRAVTRRSFSSVSPWPKVC